MAMTMLQGVFFPAPTNPQQALFDAMIKVVKDMIKQNNIKQKMDSVKNIVLGTTEELSWVPELLDSASEDVLSSYYIMLQHDLAVNARVAFGECYDDLNTDSCKDWQEAGTMELGLQYVQLHMQVFTSIYTSGTTSTSFKEVLKTKMKNVGIKYKCLLTKFYDTYKAYRLKFISGEGFGNERGKFCYWSYKVKDSFIGVTKEKAGSLKQKKIPKTHYGRKMRGDGDKKCTDYGKAERDDKQRRVTESLTEDLERAYLNPINELFGAAVIGSSESANPCAYM